MGAIWVDKGWLAPFPLHQRPVPFVVIVCSGGSLLISISFRMEYSMDCGFFVALVILYITNMPFPSIQYLDMRYLSFNATRPLKLS